MRELLVAGLPCDDRTAVAVLCEQPSGHQGRGNEKPFAPEFCGFLFRNRLNEAHVQE